MAEVTVEVWRDGQQVATLYGAGKTCGEAIDDALSAKVANPEERYHRGDQLRVIEEHL